MNKIEFGMKNLLDFMQANKERKEELKSTEEIAKAQYALQVLIDHDHDPYKLAYTIIDLYKRINILKSDLASVERAPEHSWRL